MKEWLKDIIISIILFSILIFLLILLLVPNFRGVLFERGEINGKFVSGNHRSYGDEYGEYPSTTIYMLDCFPVPSVVKDFIWHDDGSSTPFIFGNDFPSVDNMVVNEYYKINYHREYRPSDIDASRQIDYWVIDNIEKTLKP